MSKISYPFEAPQNGQALEIAPNIFWLRMPLPMQLDHINIYWFVDMDGVTIIDTGFNTSLTRELWLKVIKTYIEPKPIKRILLTHYHPDHAGLVGWFIKTFDAELLTSRLTYLLLRMLLLDHQERPDDHNIAYWRRVGYDQAWIDQKVKQKPFNMSDVVEMVPLGFRSLAEGDKLTLGGYEWVVKMGQGHAPDHLTLWNPSYALVGDQCLPAITPVISVFPTEPFADPLSEFIQSCKRLNSEADDNQLFLCGHNRPFYGGASRLLTQAHHHEKAFDLLREALKKPKTMIETYPLLFRQKINSMNEGFAISEAIAHFNHLEKRGEIASFQDEDGIIRWQLIS